MKKYSANGITYWIKGKNPNLLISSGMHGDEYQVIDLVFKYLRKNYRELPDFLYIPHLSPSAVKKGTRKNKFGHDLNRSFLKRATDKEALTVKRILSKRKFTLFID